MSALVLILAVVAWVVAGTTRAADHPSLVDPSKTRCTTCHAERVAGANLHAAAETCDSCHEFTKVEGKTTVELVASPPALCVLCHIDLEGNAEGTIDTPHFPVVDTCLNCHDPHSSENSKLLNEPIPDLCLACHEVRDLDEIHTVSVSRANCARCHQPHGAQTEAMLVEGTPHPPFAERSCGACHRRGMQARAKGDASKICFACHDAEVFQAAFVHTAVREGKCLGCHDPHSSPFGKLTKERGNELCVACHFPTVQKTKLASVHPPAVDGCDTCHAPHTGEHDKQLMDDVPAICGMCHDLEDGDLKAKHLGADLDSLRCTMCHDPHGSAESPLVAPGSIHPPFADRNCDICHEGRADELIENGSSALCLACHSEIEEIKDGSAHPHAALEVVDCTECHTPHASQNRKLLKQAEGQTCMVCHDDRSVGEGEFLHGAIELIGCESCHEPHGGENERMLRRTNVNDLCLGCHDRSRWSEGENETVTLLERFRVSRSAMDSVKTIALRDEAFDHPFAGHRTLGVPTEEEIKRGHVETIFEGELKCTSCHDPHKGRSPRLFVRGTTLVCTECHEK